ncbi:hypothetical protein CH276_19420 [Rhodococcus sp. 06-470-2]|nr:hypothetical protein CH276_19420 [Rhodococcus sp. 06-470-2]OZE08315.1 hypothetical protein CH249_18695 [Rhodococcus sp. 05-2255-3B1]OZE11648.1 hypothetical protein CH250_10105 [Rhodococcus sp. 05-2255-3C]OZE23146.1 hypothetical protein CH255_05030 [Rhodococcus sp. 05-2255-2A2]OZE61079.1 hypothetical protein CH265_19440 [Rhodococcus sp. 05-2221-1B]
MNEGERMPDEKKKAPSEADAATEKIDLRKKKVDEPADAATEKIATAPAEEPAAAESKPVAKPTAAPRRIPPRNPSENRTKDVAVEKKSPATVPQPVGPRRIEPQKPGSKQVGPQRIGPDPTEPGTPSHKKWWAALVAAVVVIGAVAAGAYLLIDRPSVDDSPEARIRTTVESFTRALAVGDLATLRSTSCGDLATFYRDIPDAEFADVHRVSLAQGNIPTVDSIDAIQVGDDDTAIAQVIAHTDANPNDRSPRTFDLRLDGDQWKVCN